MENKMEYIKRVQEILDPNSEHIKKLMEIEGKIKKLDEKENIEMSPQDLNESNLKKDDYRREQIDIKNGLAKQVESIIEESDTELTNLRKEQQTLETEWRANLAALVQNGKSVEEVQRNVLQESKAIDTKSKELNNSISNIEKQQIILKNVRYFVYKGDITKVRAELEAKLEKGKDNSQKANGAGKPQREAPGQQKNGAGKPQGNNQAPIGTAPTNAENPETTEHKCTGTVYIDYENNAIIEVTAQLQEDIRTYLTENQGKQPYEEVMQHVKDMAKEQAKCAKYGDNVDVKNKNFIPKLPERNPKYRDMKVTVVGANEQECEMLKQQNINVCKDSSNLMINGIREEIKQEREQNQNRDKNEAGRNNTSARPKGDERE